MNIISCSGGNDSVALIQWAKEKGLQDVYVCYTNTGWAMDGWQDRINSVQLLCWAYGFQFAEVQSEGMESLVKRKKGWPANGFKFCTGELKIKPFLEWLNTIDPDKESTVIVGVRREESEKRRNWPEWVEESENHEGRSLWSPFVNLKEHERNQIIERSGIEVLPYRSKECFPCVNANRADLQMLAKDEKRIVWIERIESEMGEKKTMFRPAKWHGAVGIREVLRVATGSKGHADFATGDLFGCDSGFCGD